MSFLSEALQPGNDPATFPPENYLANTRCNDIVEMCMKRPNANDSQRLQNLMDGKTEEIKLTEFVTYPDIRREGNFNTFATLLLHTGYFTYVGDPVSGKTGKTTIRIPNEEVRRCFEDRAKHLFSDENSEWQDKVLSLRDALFDADAAGVQTSSTICLSTSSASVTRRMKVSTTALWWKLFPSGHQTKYK